MNGLRLRPSYAEINLQKVRSNFLLLRSLLEPGAFFCPMVKANAYGHGAAPISRALREAGAEFLGVALVEEGVALRDGGDSGELLVFGAFFDVESAEAVFQHRLTAVISSWPQLEVLESHGISAGKKLKIHLKFNTGMNRLGFRVEDALRLRERIEHSTVFELEGLCTHLLRSEDVGIVTGSSQTQLTSFSAALASFRGMKFYAHALNSAGIVAFSKRHPDVPGLRRGSSASSSTCTLGGRPGIALYGVLPSAEASTVPSMAQLAPVLSLKSRIVALNRVPKGGVVSYNATWQAERDSLVAVIAFGCADGYSRLLSNKAKVLCRGMKAPVVGTVCMDSFMVDLTDVAERTQVTDGAIRIGEEIVLIGEQGSEKILAQELADHVGTIAYEILTGLSERVPRVYVDGGHADQRIDLSDVNSGMNSKKSAVSSSSPTEKSDPDDSDPNKNDLKGRRSQP